MERDSCELLVLSEPFMSSIGDGVTGALLDGANSLPIVLFKKWGKSLGIKMEFF